MAAADLTSLAPVFKELYPKGLAPIIAKKCPAAGWVPKQGDFYGDTAGIAPLISGVRGSTAFADALEDQSVVQTLKFNVPRKRDYAIASVDAEAMAASENDRGAFAKVLDEQTKGAMHELQESFGYQIFHNGGGSRAQGNSAWTITGNAITISDPRAHVYFQVDMRLNFATTDGTTGSVKAGYVTIDKISITPAATIITTVEANIQTAVPTVANSDHLFRKGDFGNCISGFLAWIPPTDPTATLYHGVDRTRHTTKLGGLRFNASDSSTIMEEIVIDALAYAHTHGAEPSVLIMNSLRFSELEKSLNGKTIIQIGSSVPGIGYKAIEFAAPWGTVSIMGDPKCPYNHAFALDKETVHFKHLKAFPHFAMDDGSKFQRSASADGIQFRVRWWGNLMVEKPGFNMIINWAL
jgi:hypothetical protein